METTNYNFNCPSRILFDFNRKELFSNEGIYKLEEIPAKEIAAIRKKGKSFLLYKTGKKFWWSPVPRSLSLIGATAGIGAHKCSYAENVCEYLSANEDDGGCPKARSAACRGIENFEFITEGFETVGTRPESLLVLKCQNFKKKEAPKKISPVKVRAMLEELKLFLYN